MWTSSCKQYAHYRRKSIKEGDLVFNRIVDDTKLLRHDTMKGTLIENSVSIRKASKFLEIPSGTFKKSLERLFRSKENHISREPVFVQEQEIKFVSITLGISKALYGLIPFNIRYNRIVVEIWHTVYTGCTKRKF